MQNRKLQKKMRYQIIVFEPHRPAKTFNLSTLICTIGRDPHCTIVINSPHVSKTHLTLEWVDSSPVLTDSSLNSTTVNAKQIHSTSVTLPSKAEMFIKPDFYVVFSTLKTDHQILESDIAKYYVFESYTLGVGSFASVKLAIDFKSGERLACKLQPSKYNSREARIQGSLKHPNIMRVVDQVSTSKFTCILMPRVRGGELFTLILTEYEKGRRVQDSLVKWYIYQILKALDFLHKRGIIHRDVKPENILLEQKSYCRVLLTDFGLAKEFFWFNAVRNLLARGRNAAR